MQQNLTGQLFSVGEPGAFRVVKVLAQDPGIVHLRSYANRFAERPTALDGVKLSLGGTSNMGIGHFPLAEEAFEQMNPQALTVEPVEESELEGYYIWREAWEAGEAGVFKSDPG